jgi:Protein of unknown function (DUF3016)
MKTLRLLPIVLFGLVAPLALNAADAAKAPARTEVIFSEPEKFTDVKDSDFATDRGRDDILDQIRRFVVERADATLPPGQKLTITFTDIDLAGEFEPWRGPQFSDVRIVKALYPPAFKFSYKVTDEAGQTVKSGEENIRDLSFDLRMTINRQDPLHYEKDILGDWIRSKLRASK